jgi:hypothetical protein
MTSSRYALCAFLAVFVHLLPVAARADPAVQPILGIEVGGTAGALTVVGATALARAGARVPLGMWSVGGFAECAVSKFVAVGPYSQMDGRQCLGAVELTLAEGHDPVRLHVWAGAGVEWLQRPNTEHQIEINAGVPAFALGLATSYRLFRISLETRAHLAPFPVRDSEDEDATPQFQLTFGVQLW